MFFTFAKTKLLRDKTSRISNRMDTSCERQGSGMSLLGEFVNLQTAPGLSGGAPNLLRRHAASHFLVRDQYTENGKTEKIA